MTEVKEQGSLGPADLHIDPGVVKDIVDEVAGKRRVHCLAAE
jgi:hypothetical protein